MLATRAGFTGSYPGSSVTVSQRCKQKYGLPTEWSRGAPVVGDMQTLEARKGPRDKTTQVDIHKKGPFSKWVSTQYICLQYL